MRLKRKTFPSEVTHTQVTGGGTGWAPRSCAGAVQGVAESRAAVHYCPDPLWCYNLSGG